MLAIKKFFWNNYLNIISNLVKTYFGTISSKYQLDYINCPIYIQLNKQEDYKTIVGDCYKQILHLSTNSRYLGIMRPEFTHMISKNVNLNTKNLYYIGECYRNETKQFLRFQNFTQMGCEFFANTKNKSTINTILVMVYLMEFMKILDINNEIDYKLYINSNISFINEVINLICKDKNIIFNSIKRIGGNEHSYTDFCFEIHALQKNKQNIEHEIVGGGNYNIIYKSNTILSCGFSIGLERLIYYLTYSEETNSNLINKCINTLINKINNYNSIDTIRDIYLDIKNPNIIQKLNYIVDYNGKLNIKFVK